jgi:hypothetical protein
MENVVKLKFYMPAGGAIAKIAYTWCGFNTKAPTIAPTTQAPNNDPTMIPTMKPTRKPTVGKPTMPPIPYTSDCEMTRLDFSGLTRGAYIRNQLKTQYGISIYASSWGGGYRPGGAARIFDSSNPGSYELGDPDLGSPNESCDGGGPGIGLGGAKGSEFENCKPLGNLLVVQSENKATPDDHEKGSQIEFTLDYPGVLHNITIIDNDGCNCDPVIITVR